MAIGAREQDLHSHVHLHSHVRMASIQPQTTHIYTDKGCWNSKPKLHLHKEPSELSGQSSLNFPLADCFENGRSDHTGEKRAGENA